MGEALDDARRPTRSRRPRRSRAWLLGWLAVSGPLLAGLSVSVVPVVGPGALVATMLLQFWVLAGCALAVVAVVRGALDRRDGLDGALSGAVLGAIGLLLCAVELALAVWVLDMLGSLG